VRFCACVRGISKQSQVSPKARHTRRLLLLKKSCHKELLCFYARQNARHCNRTCAATTSRPGTSALQPPLRCCVLTPGKIRQCSHVCTAATSCPGTLALQLPLRRCILMPGKTPGAATMCPPPPCHPWRLGSLALQPPLHRCVLTPGKTPALQPCVHSRHVTPGDIGLLRLDAPAAVRAPPPHHAQGIWCCSRRCATAS
jgi:hypothetical protein